MHINWINGQHDSIAKNLCAGKYEVTVTDNNGGLLIHLSA